MHFHLCIFARLGFCEAGDDIDHVLGIVKKVYEFIDDEFFNDLGGDGLDGAGLFYFGSGAGIAAIIFAIFLGGGLAVHDSVAASAAQDA